MNTDPQTGPGAEPGTLTTGAGASAPSALTAVRAEVGKAVVGQDPTVWGLLAAFLVNGHVILEGVPGVAKTLMVKALARTLDLQFRLPPGMTLPPHKDDVHIDLGEGQQHAIVSLDESWRGHDGDRQVILATASLMYKASQRVVSLALPGAPPQIWRLDLSSDPDPTPGYSAWRLPSSASATKMEMSFRLRADR